MGAGAGSEAGGPFGEDKAALAHFLSVKRRHTVRCPPAPKPVRGTDARKPGAVPYDTCPACRTAALRGRRRTVHTIVGNRTPRTGPHRKALDSNIGTRGGEHPRMPALGPEAASSKGATLDTTGPKDGGGPPEGERRAPRMPRAPFVLG